MVPTFGNKVTHQEDSKHIIRSTSYHHGEAKIKSS